jgi:phosphate transport system permease protein
MAVLLVLLGSIIYSGIGVIDWRFLTSGPSRNPERAGVLMAIAGTLWLMGLTALISIPLGVAAAIHLEEYATRNRINKFIEINIANLAGVPSVVYGLLGLAVFVRFFLTGHEFLGKSLISGALTLSLLVLPVIILTAREAIRSVPSSLREASFALGASRWQTIWRVVLPSALPGILTGVILALSRAVGETAPLIMVGAALMVTYLPNSPMDGYSALPMVIYEWSARPNPEFQRLAGGAIIVLLTLLLTFNALAVITRQRSRRKL